ncbi:hypothetical protein SAMN05421848_0380 [Kushneria avicenniae]|uniref:Uncharacterized protein n=1 Tax=Kushneria avicenniae TaxID=402385 RepID=A0A1I1G929_9GAMM|nr:hypothetical protein [Kushneria avicenniae]SFC05660.1 hypothetical protein SAMN05421848_0380 [Kushneria avicenniae]
MRTALVSIVSAFVIATTAGTAMASTQSISIGNGQSAAMAQTYANNSQPLDTSFMPHRTEKGLPAVSNGHSVAMAETYENIHQPLNHQAHSGVARENAAYASYFGYHSHSPAMTNALTSTVLLSQ